MTEPIRAAAVDLGAESGRVVLGAFDGERLTVREVHRFPNAPLRLPTGLHWNLPGLYQSILEGLRRAAREDGSPVRSVGVDTWGVDFALVDRTGALIGLPFHYRDARTGGMVAVAEAAVGREEIFRRTGIQFMEINTLYQLLAMTRGGAPALQAADRLLMIPDLLHYWLTGSMANEWTNATTTQCVSVETGTWDRDLLGRLGIPTHFLPDLCPPGTDLGPLAPAVAEETGCGEARVVVPATHDTASAVAAVPGEGEHVAYVSSGTWSLVGVVASRPAVTEAALRINVTNEGGLGGSYRVLKNVMGLWLVQQIQRALARGGEEYTYEALTRLAGEAAGAPALFDPDDPAFLRPGDMPARIREACQRTGQAAPETVGGMVRSTLVSLACKYRWVLDRLEELLGRRLTAVHVVGGGSRNSLLCRLTADITGRTVWAGPAEATAIGNLLVQLTALGHLGSPADYPAVVRSSFPPQAYEPGGGEAAEETYRRWREVTGL
ncbi:rhamnulokinase [Caldinitratiruptor microaerophilus]|uniref:Carbohydrate kinase n=1 Tax=Caldinitratiruptor microaerophilus TaxID=671077 RepID=A0AA35CKX3_9FIRM|nr:rhamnulokinase family protein [Caldinitratiruptor microaerophilus]BDG60414.1 carbohydrate kinase [Caldinitratiruptor microaerophilus]